MRSFDKNAMSCEQVEAIVFDLDREGTLNAEEKEAAIAHLANCPQCAALQESWQAAREELRALGQETIAARAPKRIEMRLRQEFRARHQGWLTRRSGALVAWALAAAAVLVGVVSVRSWQQARRGKSEAAKTMTSGAPLQSAGEPSDVASADDAEFTPLPGTTLDDSEEGAVLRVRMQRASLVALGLPVNEQRAADWIQVDLLVGNDGLPQGVRLAPEEN